MTVHDAHRQLFITMQSVYERREANAVTGMVIEYLTGLNNTDRLVHKMDVLSSGQQASFHNIIIELLAHKPVQYALHEAHWHGMKLYVDKHVLIPRPETEELVEWMLEDMQSKTPDAGYQILDMGTGSGCIAIALKKTFPSASILATDISEEALQVAKRNAEEQHTDIHFSRTDILNKDCWNEFSSFDYIVSNPPYIRESEALSMDNNVVRHEPHLALFVPNDNPLLFYDTISSFGLEHLNKGGRLFFEINESFGNEVAALLSAKGYQDIETRKDMQGKDRMIKGEVPNP